MKKKLVNVCKRDSNLPKNLTYTLLLLARHVGNPWRGRYLSAICVSSVPLQIIVSDILSISLFFFILGNRTRFMLTNIRISTIYNSHGFYRSFFTVLSTWCSKVRDRKSLLFHLAVNRN